MARSPTRLRLLEFVLWVLAASAAVIAASLTVGLVVGGDLLSGKYVLFVVGFLLFGVGSLLLQPSRPRRGRGADGSSPGEDAAGSRFGPTAGGDQYGTARDLAAGLGGLRGRLDDREPREHRFEAKIQSIGPLADHPLPFEERIGRGYKIFATSLVVLAFSFGMEVVGIHV